MSLIKSIMHQLGLSGDPAKNFTLSVPAAPDGTMKLARGNAGATTQDIMTVNAAGKVATPLMPLVGTAPMCETVNAAGWMATKFADGTMIQYVSLGLPGIPANSVFNVGDVFYGFPFAAGTVPNISLSVSSLFPFDIFPGAEQGVNNVSFGLSVRNGNASNSLAPFIMITAIGRWK